MKKTMFVLGLMFISEMSYAGIVTCTSPGDALNSLIFKSSGDRQTITITYADDSMASKVYRATEVFPDTPGVKMFTGIGKKSFAFGGGVSDALFLVLNKRSIALDGSFEGRLASIDNVIELICKEQ